MSLRTVFLCVFSALVPVSGFAKPNVIVIFTDDQGSVDAGCYGAKDVQTPAIDHLAAQGLRFTQFYAASAICSPSRAGLLTGRYPWKAGMEGNGPAAPPESIDDLTESKSRGGLPGSEVTMAEMFHQAGYATAHIGKWHLGSGQGSRPLDQGFDYSFGHMNGCIDSWSHFVYWGGPNRHDLWENNQRVRMSGRYFPDLMVDKAMDFIEEHRDEPFFMYFAVNLPHYPYQGDSKWLETYESLPFPRRLYAAALSTIDERIGRLVEYVDRIGLRDQTIIVYQSDQGHSTEERAHGGGGSAGPYRGAKFSLFEGGIRVPAIISWPSTLASGETRDALAHGCDWFPTLAGLCDIPLPGTSLDGMDLGAVLKSGTLPSPHDHLEWKMGDQWAVRQGNWKLIHRPNPVGGPDLEEKDKEWFLSNVVEHPSELENEVLDEPKEFEKLKALRGE
ncbi:arylsulfatase A-like enzyme [Haloferula luteola]|uniref:Arylsulfatase A-like enzyme n=1 Tax=Haloferula luteola TaxID=595692 RepID=A0A840V4L2_9BACT|nr:arylsulfatase A-like enzyme [Haloferula luteola]